MVKGGSSQKSNFVSLHSFGRIIAVLLSTNKIENAKRRTNKGVAKKFLIKVALALRNLGITTVTNIQELLQKT